MWDFLIVGAGLYGATAARLLTDAGKHCLVIDRRNHIGGNAYTETLAGINVHKYGAHIFHTSSKSIWNFVNQFASFNNFINSPIAIYNGQVYNLPFNMNTFSRMWNIVSPLDAKRIIDEQTKSLGIVEPRNLEEQALSLVGKDIYEKLVKGYTEKQWGRECSALPASIIKRLPCRFTYNNNYFNDVYQGIPIGGYTKMVERMLDGIEVRTGVEFREIGMCSEKVIYTGCIDEYYDYKYGALQYRSVRFETEELPMEDFQGNAVVNYTQRDIPYTRIIEHKHFEFGTQRTTIISREYPMEWENGIEPYYPINDERNIALYKKYAELAKSESKVIFGGRLGTYRYYDMDKVIGEAMTDVKRILEEK